METTNLNDARLKKAAEEVANTQKMLLGWGQKQGEAILRQMEAKRSAPTLSLHWPKIKQGWLGGFVSGVQAGFQLGYQTANKLSEQVLNQSTATLAGTEGEAIERRNAEIRELIGQAIGEASMCWSETPTGVFDSTRAASIVEKLAAHFITPIPQAAQEAEGQERLPGL